MHERPLNYIAALLMAALLWVVLAVLLAGSFVDRVSLREMDSETFSAHYQMLLGLANLLSFFFVALWFYQSGKASTLGDLPAARRRWFVLFGIEIVIAALLTLGMVFWHTGEGLTNLNYLLFILLVSLCSYIYFWICTFLWSPTGVLYVIPFRK
jgi:hypothetical protein